MIRLAVAILIVVLSAQAFAQSPPTTVGRLFAAALSVQGPDYVAAREKLVSAGKMVLPFLNDKARDKDLHTSLIARAIAGRIEHPEKYQAYEGAMNIVISFAQRAHPWPPDTVLGAAVTLPAKPGSSFSGGFPGGTGVGVPIEPDALPFLAETLLKPATLQKDPGYDSANLRTMYAAARLGFFKDPAVIPLLLETFKSDENPLVKAAAARGLGLTKDPRVVPPLSKALAAETDKSSYLAVSMICALGDTGRESAVKPIVSALTDRNHFAAVQALKRIDSPMAAQALVSALGNASKEVRFEAAMGLGEMKGEQVLRALITALKDPEPIVRFAAAGALGQIGDKAAVEPLVAAFRDKDSYVRAYAIEALGNFQDPRTPNLLLEALRDPAEDVRQAAARVEQKVKDPRAVPLLIKILTGGNLNDAPFARTTMLIGFGVTREPEDWAKWWEENKSKYPEAK